MSEFDVRKDVAAEITSIRFSNDEAKNGGFSSANIIERRVAKPGVNICDGDYDDNPENLEGFVIINNREHAENLILALNKAISLGWL